MWQSHNGTPTINSVWKFVPNTAVADANKPTQYFIQLFSNGKRLQQGSPSEQVSVTSTRYAGIDSMSLTQNWIIESPGRNKKLGQPPTISLRRPSGGGYLKHKPEAETLGNDDTSFRMVEWSEADFTNSNNDEDNWMATMIIAEMENCPLKV